MEWDRRDQGASKHGWWIQWVWPESRLIRLGGPRLRIGEAPEAEIRLLGGGLAACHAELLLEGRIYTLCDRGGDTGTWLSGTRVDKAAVATGQVIRVGEWVGVFLWDAEDIEGFRELLPGFFGGPELARLVAMIQRVAPSDIPVLLSGDTGTGKDCLARALHERSGRHGVFLPVNCAALPEPLAEAELFGYRRGAFTGAERSSVGHFRTANGGTLFLDEIAELSPALQSKLLRVLDDGRVLGLGESKPMRTDVRVVAASQRPLRKLVDEGIFRRDLAARLMGLELKVPPLSARRADIGGLFKELLARLPGGAQLTVEPRLVEALCCYGWPQNVRELALTTRTLVALHGHRRHLQLADLPTFSAVEAPPSPKRRKPSSHDLLMVAQAIERHGGNIKAAAGALGISRQRVYRVLSSAAGASSARGSRS